MQATSIYTPPARTKQEKARERRFLKFAGAAILAVILGAGMVDTMTPESSTTGEDIPDAAAFVSSDD